MKKRKTKSKPGFRFAKMHTVLILFLLLICALFLVQKNVPYRDHELLMEPEENNADLSQSAEKAECMIFWENEANARKGRDLMEAVLGQMKIPYDTCDGRNVADTDLGQYETAVLSVTDYSILSESILDIMDWVKGGGRLLILYPPSINGNFQSIGGQLGISQLGQEYHLVEGIHFTRDFMLGGTQKDYKITDPYESSLTAVLSEDCEVYAESDDTYAVPIIWRKTLDKGVVVFDNLGYLEKAYRGFYAASYSLLTDICSYPVINSSTFYIDDFPSPVPEGNSEYIKRDYGMETADFYTQVWWKDVYNLAEKYGIRYTGLVIEQYSDKVEAPFSRNTDIQRFRYFGNMLLDQGGEIGFHGYNHMPLCLVGFDYEDEYDSYRLWKNDEDMEDSVRELKKFCEILFPDEKFRVYVPPSNIISDEGREVLKKNTDIRAIASLYLPEDSGIAYEQEFEVSEDGIVETPRVISGYILDDYMQIAALSELNFHYVNSHFQHPDDTLDADRGAALGWEKMCDNLDGYMDWLYTAAPDIRNLTGTEFAAAVQIYDDLQIRRSFTGEKLTLDLGGFRGEAWIMLRFNGPVPDGVTGGSMEQLLDGLYLLKAEDSRVEIQIRQEAD